MQATFFVLVAWLLIRADGTRKRAHFPERDPEVCACLLSYNRLDLLRLTLSTFIDHMETSEPNVRYEIVWIDNGSFQQDDIEQIMGDFEIEKAMPLDYNSGIAHAFNTMFFELCSAPFILSLEEDWKWQRPVLARDTDPYPHAISLAIEILNFDPQVASVILRQEHAIWFTKTRRSESLKLPNTNIEYRRHCLNLQAGHVWGAYTNGASLMHKERLKQIGHLFGEFTKNIAGEEAKHDKSKLLEKSLGFPRAYTEANYALRVGLRYCSAVMRLVAACDPDTHVDAVCNGVFVHTGEGRSHGVDSVNHNKQQTHTPNNSPPQGNSQHEPAWVMLGTPLYDKFKDEL